MVTDGLLSARESSSDAEAGRSLVQAQRESVLRIAFAPQGRTANGFLMMQLASGGVILIRQLER